MKTVTKIKAGLLGVMLSLAHANPIGAFSLTVLHNNDGESQILPNTVTLDDGREVEAAGAAYFTDIVEDIKNNATNAVITLSSGDNFLAGTAFNASLEDDIFYDAVVLNAIGYDAIALGNHDFDFGPDILADFIGAVDSDVPFLASNLDYGGEPELQALVDQGRISESTIVTKDGEQIGVIGAITPTLPNISSPRSVEVISDVAGEVQEEIDALQAQGVNKIILISHLQGIEEEQALIPQLSGVDIVIAGGGDNLLADSDTPLLPGDTAEAPYPLTVTNADGDTVPVVTTAGSYQYVGRLEVEFNDAGEVTSFNGMPVRVLSSDPGVEQDQFVVENAVEPVQESVTDLANNVLATSEVDLNGTRGSFETGEAGVRTAETNLGSLVADALLYQATQLADDFGLEEPDVAIQNGGGIRNTFVIDAGEFTEEDTFDTLPFANFVSIVPEVSPSEFKAILENAVSQVEGTSGRFAQIAGFEFTYNLDGSPRLVDENGNVTQTGTRVEMVVLDDGTVIVENGQVVAGAPDISIATIDFLARLRENGLGGDEYPFPEGFVSLGVTYQQALENYVTEALDGQITAAQYPEGGSGRITEIDEPGTGGGTATTPEPASVLALLGVGFGLWIRRRR